MTTKKPSIILREAMELTLAHPYYGWFAVDAAGQHVRSADPSAVKWCAAGAVSKCGHESDGLIAAFGYLERAAAEVGYKRIDGTPSCAANVNDNNPELVGPMFWQAIRLAEARGD